MKAGVVQYNFTHKSIHYPNYPVLAYVYLTSYFAMAKPACMWEIVGSPECARLREEVKYLTKPV